MRTRSYNTYSTPAPKFKKLIAREVLILISMIFILIIVWFGGNIILENYYKPKFEKISNKIEELNKDKSLLAGKLSKEQFKLMTKEFIDRYNPDQETIESDDLLFEVYQKYSYNNYKYLTFLFKKYIPSYDKAMYSEEIQAFEKDLGKKLLGISNKIVGATNAKKNEQEQIKDKDSQNLKRLFLLHNIIMALIVFMAYPGRFLFYLISWARRTLR